MGLDMYLTKRHYVRQWDHTPAEDRYEIKVYKGGQLIKTDPHKIAYVIENVHQWRKANQIHAWFVENVQGGKDECQESYLEHDSLQELLSTCIKVLQDHSLAPELLPVSQGFFFGSDTYDEEYFQDVADTATTLTKELAGDTAWPGEEYYYQASW